MECLEIKNFLGLNAKFEVAKINIFIGPQASGKSVVAKLFYLFKKTFLELLRSIEEQDPRHGFGGRIKLLFREYFPQNACGSADFEIKYSIAGLELKIQQKNKKLTFSPCKEFKLAHYYLRQRQAKFLENNKGSEDDVEDFPRFKLRQELFAGFLRKFPKTTAVRPIFVPAGRSFFALLQNSIFSFLSSNNAIDPFLKEFGLFYEDIKPLIFRPPRDDSRKQISDELRAYSSKLLGGKYRREKGRDILLLEGERKVDVSISSSGQQEVLPLTLILRILPLIKFREPNITLFLEEPEAHIFPKAQRVFLEFLSLSIKLSLSNVQAFLTTHSPYLLAAMNNLIEANSLTESSLAKIGIKKNATIKKDDISAWYFENGTARDIFDKETGLINAREIDRVSDEIASEFESIMGEEN